MKLDDIAKGAAYTDGMGNVWRVLQIDRTTVRDAMVEDAATVGEMHAHPNDLVHYEIVSGIPVSFDGSTGISADGFITFVLELEAFAAWAQASVNVIKAG